MLRMTAKALESGSQGQGERVRGQHRAQDLSLLPCLCLTLLVSGSQTLEDPKASGAGWTGKRKGLFSVRLGGLRGSES